MSELFDSSPYQVPPPPPTRLQQVRARYGGRSPVRTAEWQRYRRRVLPIFLERQGYKCALCGYPIDPELDGNHAMGATLDHVVPLHAGATARSPWLRTGCISPKKWHVGATSRSAWLGGRGA